MALLSDHGRDHDLGTLGLYVARRHHQPGADDQLQPLRARGSGRLDASSDRWYRSARARLLTCSHRPASQAAALPGPRHLSGRDMALSPPHGPRMRESRDWRSTSRKGSPLSSVPRRARARADRGPAQSGVEPTAGRDRLGQSRPWGKSGETQRETGESRPRVGTVWAELTAGQRNLT